jgi:hypothetical protein
MQQKLPAKEIERRLGLQYAQHLKENPQTASVYKDYQEAIQTTLTFMEHYNKISLAIKNKLPARKSASNSFFGQSKQEWSK